MYRVTQDNFFPLSKNYNNTYVHTVDSSGKLVFYSPLTLQATFKFLKKYKGIRVAKLANMGVLSLKGKGKRKLYVRIYYTFKNFLRLHTYMYMYILHVGRRCKCSKCTL